MNTQGQDNFVTALDERIRRISREAVEEEQAKGRGPASSPDDDSEGRNLRDALRPRRPKFILLKSIGRR